MSDARPPAAALVRAPSGRIVEAELTHLDRAPIDLERVRAQHDGYLEVLARHGVDLVRLPELPDHPDGVFVEDTVVVVDDLAVLTRPGATSRRGEVSSVRAALAARGYRLAEIAAPATLDGGDVLQVADTVYVGQTTRTSAAGAAQLAALLAPLARRVVPVPVTGMLHLKSAATALPDGTIVAVPGCVPLDAFEGREVVAAEEAAGGDVLLLGQTVVVSASAPRTAAAIALRGFAVEVVELSELEKAEAGVTCLSVLLPARSG